MRVLVCLALVLFLGMDQAARAQEVMPPPPAAVETAPEAPAPWRDVVIEAAIGTGFGILARVTAFATVGVVGALVVGMATLNAGGIRAGAQDQASAVTTQSLLLMLGVLVPITLVAAPGLDVMLFATGVGLRPSAPRRAFLLGVLAALPSLVALGFFGLGATSAAALLWLAPRSVAPTGNAIGDRTLAPLMLLALGGTLVGMAWCAGYDLLVRPVVYVVVRRGLG